MRNDEPGARNAVTVEILTMQHDAYGTSDSARVEWCLRDFHSLLHACSLVCTHSFLDLHPQVAETVLQWNNTT